MMIDCQKRAILLSIKDNEEMDVYLYNLGVNPESSKGGMHIGNDFGEDGYEVCGGPIDSSGRCQRCKKAIY